MTTTPTQQPDALRLADELDAESTSGRVSNHTGRRAATELRCLSAEITSLTYENKALKAKNQPLAIHAISDIAEGLTVWSDGKYVIDDYFAFARAIEAAHGIVEKT